MKRIHSRITKILLQEIVASKIELSDYTNMENSMQKLEVLEVEITSQIWD